MLPILCISAILLSAFQFSQAKEISEGSSFEKPIKWVDFDVTANAMNDALSVDIKTHNSDHPFCWIEILAYLAQKYGGDFKRYKESDIDALLDACRETQIREFAKNQKLYDYYVKAYEAVLGGIVGERTIEKLNEAGKVISSDTSYGFMSYYPIPAGYYCSDFDDFGAERTWGYKRPHLGHDMVGDVGTPIVAIESGYVEALGWNQYGGWRVGIRSFDNKRYYYYAHLRKGHPYNDDLYEGKIVAAGEIIGFLGMTGYSSVEDTNNITTPHLHIGLQLIFSPEQKDGENQIWVDFYQLSKFLSKNKAIAYKDEESGRYFSNVRLTNSALPD